MALSFIVPELSAIEVAIAGMGILDVFGSCDLDPMTFIYEHDPYCLNLPGAIYRVCKYELPTLSFRTLSSDRHYIH